MKKAIYIFAAMLLAGACSNYDLPVRPEDDGSVEGKMVSVEFTVPVPPQTRGAMGKNPILDGDMYIAVFNRNQVLKQFAKATFLGQIPGTNGTLGRFEADLWMSKAWRSLHFIANCPVTEPNEIVGEAAVLSSICTANGDAAYWQRIVLPYGIDGYTYAGGHLDTYPWFTGAAGAFTYHTGYYTYESGGNVIQVNVGDYIKRNGEKILTGTGFFASQEVQDALAEVPLARNFARITVTGAAGGNFVPTQFALAHTPTAGYVAPNDRTKNTFEENWGFVSSYLPETIATTFPTHAAVAATGYFPAMPAVASISNVCPTSFISVDDATDNGAYMYERCINLQGRPATCILVSGTLNGVANRWLKIQIADPDGNYFNIYRGVTYNIEIGQVSGTDGYETAQEAFDNSPVGDISAAPETANLTSISDNKGSTLTVNAIDYVSLLETVSCKVLLYRLKHNNDPSPTANVTLEYSNITSSPAINTVSDGQLYIDGTPISLPNGTVVTPQPPDSDGGWYYSIVTLFPAQPGIKAKGRVKVKGPTLINPQKFLERVVSYRVLGAQTLGLAAGTSGTNKTITITLPEDLGYSMFPLIFKIEAEQNNLNPVTANLPVETGPSYFRTDESSFYFLYTLDYSDYYDGTTYHNTKELVFKTTNSVTPIRVSVTDKGGYFKTDEASAVVTIN